MALWVFVYLGTTPIGSILTGWIISAGGPRVALLVGAGACVAAAVLAAFVHTPPHPDDALTDLVERRARRVPAPSLAAVDAWTGTPER